MTNMFERIRYGLQRFMYGRNGSDQLSWALILAGILLCVISSLTSAFCMQWGRSHWCLRFIACTPEIWRSATRKIPGSSIFLPELKTVRIAIFPARTAARWCVFHGEREESISAAPSAADSLSEKHEPNAATVCPWRCFQLWDRKQGAA